MLFIIKIFAAVIAGALGVLGVVFDYRKKDCPQLTPIGLAAVALIIISLFIAIGAELLERKRDLTEREESERRHSEDVKMRLDENTRLLTVIYQSSVPLGDVEATLFLDLDYAKHAAYFKKLEFLVSNLKAGDNHLKGFGNTDFFAPQPTIMKSDWVPVLAVEKDEAQLAQSLIPKGNGTQIRVQRQDRKLAGVLHFGKVFKFELLREKKHLLIEYTAAHVEWSNPTKADVSLFDLANSEVEIELDFRPEAAVKELQLRVPSSNHRVAASDLTVASQEPLLVRGTFKTP